jgi:NAD(P)-dependent dehydrogenase (short-subunit alcohol dehydrogenase family)
MRDVAGRTAFVTGGASSLGLAMARSFAKAGVNGAPFRQRVSRLPVRNTHCWFAGALRRVRAKIPVTAKQANNSA